MVSSPGQTDFSRQAIPESWTEAAAEAPSGDDRRLSKLNRFRAAPERDTLDLFTACLAASAVAIVSGVAWYQVDASGVTSPVTPLVIGLALAVAVRLGGGGQDGQSRGVLAVLFYLATAAVVIFLVTSRSYEQLYGSSPDWREFEDELLNSRLTEPLSVVGWFGGATIAVWASKLFR